MESQVFGFRRRKLKHEIGREPFTIPFDRLVQIEGGHAIKHSQITVQQDLLTANQEDGFFDSLLGRGRSWVHGCGHKSRDESALRPRQRQSVFRGVGLGSCSPKKVAEASRLGFIF
jgi:hypothetical protein